MLVTASREEFPDFASFYSYYLGEHSDPVCRRLHFVGTALVIITAALAVLLGRWWLLVLLPVFGYGFAWAGHFFFEKNRPATFRHPLYSLAGDFVMFRDMLFGRIHF